jgi:hypothetical protein
LLIESLLRSVRQVSLTSWAALVFLIGPFLSILIAPFCLLGFERFGVQWHVLLLSCLGAAALVVPQAGFFPFVKRLLASRRVSASVAVFVVCLLVMGFVHGFAAQAESLLSAAMLLLMLPIGLYVALDPYRQWSIGDLALALLLGLWGLGWLGGPPLLKWQLQNQASAALGRTVTVSVDGVPSFQGAFSTDCTWFTRPMMAQTGWR